MKDQEEMVARALCEADGFDPDEVVLEGNPDFYLDVDTDDDGNPIPTLPRWENYRPLARRAIAAWRVLAGSK